MKTKCDSCGLLHRIEVIEDLGFCLRCGAEIENPLVPTLVVSGGVKAR